MQSILCVVIFIYQLLFTADFADKVFVFQGFQVKAFCSHKTAPALNPCRKKRNKQKRKPHKNLFTPLSVINRLIASIKRSFNSGVFSTFLCPIKQHVFIIAPLKAKRVVENIRYVSKRLLVLYWNNIKRCRVPYDTRHRRIYLSRKSATTRLLAHIVRLMEFVNTIRDIILPRLYPSI